MERGDAAWSCEANGGRTNGGKEAGRGRAAEAPGEIAAKGWRDIAWREGRHRRRRWVSPGSIAATLLWIAGSAGFSFYASNFGSYNQTNGTLGGVIVLLTWLWLSAFIVLLGAELNSAIEHQTVRDTTKGPEQSMGERGRKWPIRWTRCREAGRPGALG